MQVITNNYLHIVFFETYKRQTMKKLILILMILLSYSAYSSKFLENPSIHPNNNTIYFSYDGDILGYNMINKEYSRITALDGIESNPVVSPDGLYLAFSSNEESNFNVYVLEFETGKITQLTYNDSKDMVYSWSWDSKNIYFNSDRNNVISSYKVEIKGGTPKRIFEGAKIWAHNIIELPNENAYIFNESWESYRFPQRKRYKGDFNPDLKKYNLDTKDFNKLTSYRGKDLWQTSDKNGVIYFASDRDNGEYNLYKLENGNITNQTKFETSIKNPRVSYDGSQVIFEKEYGLSLYNTSTNEIENISINLPENISISQNLKEFKTSGNISYFDVSPDNKKACFVSRGKLFASDIDGKFIQELKTDNSERILQSFWLDDNEHIVYTQTVKGYLNIFKISAKTNEIDQLTDFNQNTNELNLNKDKTKGLYYVGRNLLNEIDFESGESKTLVEDEFWSIYNDPAVFSPDGKYILYSAIRNFERDIFLLEIKSKEITNLTKTGMNEESPMWNYNGEKFYFTTDRFNPGYPRGEQNTDIYKIDLTNIERDILNKEYEQLFNTDTTEKEEPDYEYDLQNLKDRWSRMVGKPRNQSMVHYTKKKDKEYLYYISNEDGNAYKLYILSAKQFDKPETTEIKIPGSIRSINIVESDAIYALVGGNVYKIEPNSGKADKIDFKFDFTKSLSDEFNQMFYETWANMEENFYDGTFRGLDWMTIRDKYASFLPYVQTRDNLRTLLNDMLGELNSSHQGFSSSGDEEDVYYKNRTFETGIVFKNNSPFEVDRILNNSPADKNNIDVQEGDILLSVNGIELDNKENRYKYFTSPNYPKEVILKFKRGSKEYETIIKPISRAQFTQLIYDEWVENNQKFVDEASNNRIAYIHMKNMGGGELNNFLIEISNELHYRDALILDLRYNRGGNVHDEVLQTLSQKQYLNWSYRDGALAQQPNFSPSSKPIVLLINEQSLSDAEMTAAGFKALDLGKIVGTETYRWIIFTSGKSLVDGSFYRVPAWGCYTLTGEDLEMTGVAPDIYVGKSFKEKLEDKKPQLEKAIELIMKEIQD